MVTRHLKQTDTIPYSLLLLADEEIQAIERYIFQSDMYVVETDKKVIGVYALYPIDKQTAEIKAIAVGEEHQNRGIGKFMLMDAQDKAREKGFGILLIGTPTIAKKQLAIYSKAGFNLSHVIKNFFIDHYSAPIFEEGIQLTDMAVLKKLL